MYPPGRAGLKLEGHCIETAARLECRRLEYLLFDMSGQDADRPPVEERLGIVQRFLQKTDFRTLRAQRPELDGRTKMKVVVWERQDGTFALEDVIPVTGE
jgi:hypothetical protein